MRQILIYLLICVRETNLVLHIIQFRTSYHSITYHLNIVHLGQDCWLNTYLQNMGEALKNPMQQAAMLDET